MAGPGEGQRWRGAGGVPGLRSPTSRCPRLGPPWEDKWRTQRARAEASGKGPLARAPCVGKAGWGRLSRLWSEPRAAHQARAPAEAGEVRQAWQRLEAQHELPLPGGVGAAAGLACHLAKLSERKAASGERVCEQVKPAPQAGPALAQWGWSAKLAPGHESLPEALPVSPALPAPSLRGLHWTGPRRGRTRPGCRAAGSGLCWPVYPAGSPAWGMGNFFIRHWEAQQPFKRASYPPPPNLSLST